MATRGSIAAGPTIRFSSIGSASPNRHSRPSWTSCCAHGDIGAAAGQRQRGCAQGDSMKRLILVVTALGCLVLPARAQDTFMPDAEGFIRNWLVLAPIAMTGQSG